MNRIRTEKPKEFLLALATAITVILVGVEEGILLAILLSLLQHIQKSYRPFSGIVIHDPNEQWRLIKLEPDKFIESGLVMYWFGAELYYANANHFAAEVRQLIGQDKITPRWLAIDASALTSVDFSAGLMLQDLLQELKKKKISLVFTRVDQSLRSDLDQLGITDEIGEEHLFLSRSSCIEAFRKSSAGNSENTI
jgi:MFS superfamily sulfate permease-like transporter